MKQFEKSLAKQLVIARKAHNMLQQDLAKTVGLSRASISNIERGHQSLSLAMFCEISYVLECDPWVLLEAAVSGKKPRLDLLRHVNDSKIRLMIEETVKA